MLSRTLNFKTLLDTNIKLAKYAIIRLQKSIIHMLESLNILLEFKLIYNFQIYRIICTVNLELTNIIYIQKFEKI